MLQRPKFFSALRENVFCRFEFAGGLFDIDAVFENTCFISPKPAGCAPELLALQTRSR